MRRSTLVVCLLGALVVASTAGAGTITGKVTFDDDKVPSLKPLQMDADPACAAKHSTAVANEMLVVGADRGLANIFVQVTDAPAKQHAAPKEAVVIDQNGCMYQPHVAGVLVGQTLQFRNSDGILHNVHGRPKVNREFNLGMPRSLTEKNTEFTKPEPLFPVKCDVHPWMQAFVAVMEHPYFDVTGPDGAFSIGDLPDGTYTVTAWHEKLPTQTAKVTVSGGKGQADFSFTTPKKGS